VTAFLTGLVFLLGAALSQAAPQEEPGQAATPGSLHSILEEAAADLCGLAEALQKEGHLSLAARALDVCVGLTPENPDAGAVGDAIGSRKSALPRRAEPIDRVLRSKELFNGKSLAGWKKSRGKWEAANAGIRCDAEKSEGTLLVLRPPKDCRGYSLDLTFERDATGGAGIILGKAGRSRVGVIFGDEGCALYDFSESKALGEWSRRKFPPRRAQSVVVRIEMGETTVAVKGKPVLEGILSAWEPGTLGLFASEGALFKTVRLVPLEIDACLERAAELLKKRDAVQAASLLLRGKEVEKKSFLCAGHLAAALDDLGFRDAAAEEARLFLSWCDGTRPDRSDLKRLIRRAEAITTGASEARRMLDGALSAWAEKILAAGEAALPTAGGEALADQDRSTTLDAVVNALEIVDTRLDRVEDFRTRLFLARHGNAEGAALFNGVTLDGWTTRTGVWEVAEPFDGDPATPGAGGILTVVGGKGANEIETDGLPPFDRYVLALKIRGTGAYIDQGISFFVRGEKWSLRFFRFMSTQEVTMSHKGVSVLFSPVPGEALTSTRWHDVECVVHINRLTVLLDKKVLFTKVLPAPPEGKMGLFVANDRRGHFDAIEFKPLGRTGEYEALLDRIGVALREVTECETLKQGETVTAGRVHEQPFAYGGHSLTASADPKTRAHLTFRFKTVAIDDALLSVRYATHRRDAPRTASRGGKDQTRQNSTWSSLRVDVDGRAQAGTLHINDTRSRNDFVYARVPLGDLAFGWHEIRLEPPAGGGTVFFDRIVLSDERNAPQEESKIVDSDAAPHFKIRLSPGVRLPDNSEEIFALLEVLRAYMVDHYGFEPILTQYYNLIARECWGDPHKGGYATGDNLYVPEETTARNLAVIMHELSHNFDRGMGFNPPWFGEGKSFPIYVKFTRDTKGQYRAHQSPHMKRDMTQGGIAFDQLEVGGENLLQYWGTPKFPYWGKLPDGRNVTVLGYQASNWLCWELSLFLGEGWLKNYFDLVRKDQGDKTFFLPKERVAANSVVVDYFARSSGKDARTFFEDHRFRLVDLYDWDEIIADCGDDDETYLTDGGTSVVEPTGGEAPAARKGGKRKAKSRSIDKQSRIVTEGSFTYAFPVPPDAERVTLEITRSGYGTCHVWDRRIFKGKTPTGAETKSITLDDPSLWAGSRLRLTFAPDRFGDRALEVAKIVIKKD